MKPIVLMVGKSGVGKNFIASAFNLTSVPSFTTRQKRDTETPGLEHEFVTMKSWTTVFSRQKNIVAKTFFDGNYYWATLEQLESEQYNVYIIDPEGVYYFLKNFGSAIGRPYKIVYLKTSLLNRIKHMRKRGDSWKNVIRRLYNDFPQFDAFEQDKNVQKLVVRV